MQHPFSFARFSDAGENMVGTSPLFVTDMSALTQEEMGHMFRPNRLHHPDLSRICKKDSAVSALRYENLCKNSPCF